MSVVLQVKLLDGEREQRGKEAAELQARLSLEEQRDEQRGKDNFLLKQQLSEAESARNSLKKEVCLCLLHEHRYSDSDDLFMMIYLFIKFVVCFSFCSFLSGLQRIS